MKKLFLVVMLTMIPFVAFAAYKTIYEIPVVVNVIGDADDSNVKAAIDRANEILAQAGVRLSVVHTQSIDIGPGADPDSIEDKDEIKEAYAKGVAELNKHCGSGKGIKLNITNGILNEPNTSGYATHIGSRVIFARDLNSDSDDLGSDIAHEVAHALGIAEDYDSPSDPNYSTNLMGYGGGSNIRPDQAERMRKKAKKTGNAVKAQPPVNVPPKVVVPVNPGRQIVTPSGDHKFDPNSIDIYPPPSDFILAELLSKGLNLTDSQGTNDPEDEDSTVKLEIYPEGLLLHKSEIPVDWDIQSMNYTIILTSPSVGQAATIIVDIVDTGTEFIPTANWNDQTGSMPLDSVNLQLINSCRLNNIPGVGGESLPACHALMVDIPKALLMQAELHLVPLDIEITSRTFIEDPGPDPLIEATKSMYLSIAAPDMTPNPCRSISVANNEIDYILYGCGLEPLSEYEISIDMAPVGMITADPTGCLEFILPSGTEGEELLLPESIHLISIAQKPTIPLPPDQQPYWTTFELTTAESIEGDINNDGTVDMADFVKLAGNWLAGSIVN